MSVCLNRTFYGIETNYQLEASFKDLSLNRTFYGIETSALEGDQLLTEVLIVPFMELKLRRALRQTPACKS